MNNKPRIKKIVTSLWIIFTIVAVFALGYYFINKLFGENEYCQSLVKQKDISAEYSCKVTKEYQLEGKNYVDMTVERTNKDAEDRATYTMEKDTKTIR